MPNLPGDAPTKIRVDMYNRHFTVYVNSMGFAYRIIERVVQNKGHPFLERLADVPRWNLKTNGRPKRGVYLPIIQEAEKVLSTQK